MADLATIEQALRNADAAGDVAAATRLAAAYRAAQAEQQPSVPATPQRPAPSLTGDIVASAGTGLREGLADSAGTVGDIANAAGIRPDTYAGRIVSAVLPFGIGRAIAAAPTSRQTNAAMEANTGAYHQPETIPGSYAETVAQFAPAALSPGSAGKRVLRTVLPALASETAGQFTKGTDAEPYARTIAALAAGGATGVGEALATKGPAAPTLAEISAQKQAAYKAAKDAGVVISPQAWNTFATDLGQQLTKDGVAHPDLHKNGLTALGIIQDETAGGQPITLERAEKVRRAVNGAIEQAAGPNGNKEDLAMAMAAKRGLDRFLDGLQPGDTVSGDASKAVPILRQARDLASRQFKAEEIQKIVDLAENSAATNYSASGREQAIRAGFKNLNAKLIRDDNLAKTFSPDERAAIEKVVQGGPIENGLRYLGKFSPNGFLSTMLTGGAGYTLGGPVGAVAALGAGSAARTGADAMTMGNVRRLEEIVRNGGKLSVNRPSISRAALNSSVAPVAVQLQQLAAQPSTQSLAQ